MFLPRLAVSMHLIVDEAVALRFHESAPAGGPDHMSSAPLWHWISEALPLEQHDVSCRRLLDNVNGQGKGMMAGNGNVFLMTNVILATSRTPSGALWMLVFCNPNGIVMTSAKWDRANLEPDFDA